MKLRIDRDVLADAVTWAARTLPAKAPTPVLSGLHLSAEAATLAGGTVTVSAFDYETSGRASVAGDVAEGGSVVVAGRQLAEIVKSLPSRPVDVSTDGSKVRIVCGSAKFTLLTMPVDDYPTLPGMPAAVGSIPAGLFASVVAQVAVAASKDMAVPMLTCVNVTAGGGRLTLQATDRYRLAERSIAWSPAGDVTVASALVRARVMSDVSKTLTAGEDVRLGLSESMMGFEVEGRQSTTLLMDAKYPDVGRVFPKDVAVVAVVNHAEMIEAVRRVALVADRHAAIRCVFADGVVTVSAGAGEDAQASETLDCDITGDLPDGEFASGFNPEYLVDGLSAVGTPHVRLSFTEPGKPVVLTGQTVRDGADDVSYRYLLMPMRS